MGRRVGILMLVFSAALASCESEQKFYKISDLPSDVSFLYGTWEGSGPHGVGGGVSKIQISGNDIQSWSIPDTRDFDLTRGIMKVRFGDYTANFELKEYASGVAIFPNGFDPIYIRRSQNEWHLVQNINAIRNERMIFKKVSGAAPQEGLLPQIDRTPKR